MSNGSDLSDKARRLLEKVSERPNSHRAFKGALGFSDEEYESAKSELLAAHLVALRRCRGGGLRLVTPEADLPDIDADAIIKVAKAAELELHDEEASVEKAEHDFYPYVRHWAESVGYDSVAIVGDLHRRDKWENPDLIAITTDDLVWFPGVDIEIATIEVKLTFTAYAIWQAAHYCQFSHYVYLACADAPNDIRNRATGRLYELAVSLGLGIVSMTTAGAGGKGITCREINSAKRQAPGVLEMDRLLSDFRDQLPSLRSAGQTVIKQMQLVD